MAEQKKSDGADNQDDGAVQKKDDGASKSSGPGVNPKIIYLALAINLIAIIAVGFFVFKSNKKHSADPSISDIKKESDADAKAEADKATTDETNYIKESFTVNLADADTQHFALVDVTIEVPNAFVKAEVEKNRPKIRDFIVILLSSKSLDEVSNPDGREFLREEIRTKIDGFLTKGEIKTVLFEKFIIQ